MVGWGLLKELLERIDREVVIEDHDMVIGLEDGIPINHTGAAIAHHPPEGHVCGEFQVTNAAPHDMGVTTSDELNNFCIIDQ
jgi:hypothetical protein